VATSFIENQKALIHRRLDLIVKTFVIFFFILVISSAVRQSSQTQ